MIVTINGGTQGLGEAVSRRLVSTKHATGLVLTGRSAERGQTLAEELSQLGTPSIFVQTDIAEPDAPAYVVGVCTDRFGIVQGLVNGAATTSRATVFEDTSEHFARQMAINVKAPYFLIQAAARVMIENGETKPNTKQQPSTNTTPLKRHNQPVRQTGSTPHHRVRRTSRAVLLRSASGVGRRVATRPIRARLLLDGRPRPTPIRPRRTVLHGLRTLLGTVHLLRCQTAQVG